MSNGKPSILQTLENRAARLGIPIDELLRRDRESLRKSTYPTAQCLDISLFNLAITDKAREVAPMTNEQLLAMIGHVLECPMCAAQVMVFNKNVAENKKS